MQIEISIENIDSSNAYIRYPSNTDVIVKNIKQYLSHTSEQFSTVLRSVPQLLSLINYDKFLDFCLDNSVIVDSNTLHRPEFFKPCYLPDEIKKAIKNQLKRFVLADKDIVHDINLRNQSRIEQAISHHAQSIINLLDQTPSNVDEHRHALIDYCVKLDRLRKHDLRNFVPELAEFLDQYGYAKKRYQD